MDLPCSAQRYLYHVNWMQHVSVRTLAALFLWYSTGVELHHLWEEGEHHDHTSATSLCSSELHPECELCWAVVAPALEPGTPPVLQHPAHVLAAPPQGYQVSFVPTAVHRHLGRAPPVV
jgi:hypothetical protein